MRQPLLAALAALLSCGCVRFPEDAAFACTAADGCGPGMICDLPHGLCVLAAAPGGGGSGGDPAGGGSGGGDGGSSGSGGSGGAAGAGGEGGAAPDLPHASLHFSQGARAEMSPVAELVPTAGLTVEAWISIDAIDVGGPSGEDHAVAGIWDETMQGGASYALLIGRAPHLNEVLTAAFELADVAGNIVRATGYAGIGRATFCHLAGTWDGEVVRLYVDGSADGVPQAFAGPLAPSPAPFRIGQLLRAAGERNMEGVIAEVRVWGEAHDELRIRDERFSRLRGDEPGLLGYWQLDEGVSDLAIDTSRAGRDGTLHGLFSWIPSGIPLTPAAPQPATHPGCADGTPDGLAREGLVTCAGRWDGLVTSPSAGALCGTGFHPCSAASLQDLGILRTLGYHEATGFPGCFAYAAAADGDGCFECVAGTGHNDLAAVGHGCPYKNDNRNAASCLDGGSVSAYCCGNWEYDCAFTDWLTGILCCVGP